MRLKACRATRFVTIWLMVLEAAPLAGEASSPKALAKDISEYQRRGLLRRADSLIALLPQGIMRDTLQIRQAWFFGRTGEALRRSLLLDTSPAWREARLEAMLWRLRALLFDDDASILAALDSAAFTPAWPHAAEILGYKYRARLVCTATDRAAWACVARACFLGLPAQAAASPALRVCTTPMRLVLVSDLAKSFIDHNNPADALAILDNISDSLRTTEQRYLRGKALLLLDRPEEGRAELERLIVVHPQDVFSTRARLLLSRH